MGRGLFDYSEMIPTAEELQQETQRPADGIDSYLQRRAVLDQSKQLLQSIESQLQQGTPPQYVLYTALRAIGLLTGASEWEARQRAALDTIYSDLAQESLFVDNAATAAERLADQRRDYVEKLRRTLGRQLKGLAKVERALNEALDAAQELDDPPDIHNLELPPSK